MLTGSLRKKPYREAFIELLNGLLVAGLYWSMILSGADADIQSSGYLQFALVKSLPAVLPEYQYPTLWLHLWYSLSIRDDRSPRRRDLLH
ncbi:MAG: hypothetical protein R3C11_17450 [Planctomycetaceae bacterium]